MKILKIIAFSLFGLLLFILTTSFSNNSSNGVYLKNEVSEICQQNQTINLFVTHGHCSLPFAGNVEKLKVIPMVRNDQGNPLEQMKISFEINPCSFNVCNSEELTSKIRMPGLFINEKDEKITFNSTQIYTMGLDWYQVNGIMFIKGVSNDVIFFVTGIRDPQEAMASSLVLGGQINLLDWGIDYDLIVNGKSNNVPTKWMYMNMRIDLIN